MKETEAHKQWSERKRRREHWETIYYEVAHALLLEHPELSVEQAQARAIEWADRMHAPVERRRADPRWHEGPEPTPAYEREPT